MAVKQFATDPKNGDYVKFWSDAPTPTGEAAVGYIEGIVDVAVKLDKDVTMCRIIDGNGRVHDVSANELVPRVEYINVYSVSRRYGGPEEGGWYYDTGDPVASIPVYGAHEAQRVRQEMHRRYKQDENGKQIRNTRYSVLGGDDFEVVSEDKFAESYPKETPHYE